MEYLHLAKKALVFLYLICAWGIGNSQICSSFYLLQNNKTITINLQNNRGFSNGKIIYKTASRNIKGASISAVIHTSLSDKDGKVVNHGTSKVKCNNGLIMMDMNLFLPHQQLEQFNQSHAKVKEAFLEYPANINPNVILKDGNYLMEIDNNGIKQILKMAIFNRKAKSPETITTPAGSWNCIPITYQVKLNIQTGPIDIPFNYEVTEWFVPEFGIIKTRSEAGTSEIVSIQ